MFEVDPETGEVKPLEREVILAHVSMYDVVYGLWSITEERQVPMYPDTVGGQVALEQAEAVLAAYSPEKSNWASVLDRVTASGDLNNRWLILANPDGLSLKEMFDQLSIR